MMNAIKLLAFMLCDWLPESLLIRLDVVIVCNIDRYDSGKEDIIIMLKRLSDKVDPIFDRLSCHCIIVWK